jgi:Zn-dependent peptidase ImmA (M78 family)/transcriptional regulator with XRE-family HTH domain
MDQAGVSDADLGHRCNVPPSEVARWRTGTSQPTKTEFRQLVQFLQRPSSFFFLAEPPSDPAIPPDFRHPPGVEGERDPTRAEARALRTARRLQDITHWVREKGDQREAKIPNIPHNTGVAKAATNAREWLDWGTQLQRQLPGPAQVLNVLRERLEDRGLLVLLLAMGEDDCRGFSLPDKFAPVVGINTAYNPAARLFTCVHELGHLLRRDDCLCIGFEQRGIERWCERFASAFLLPETELTSYIAEHFSKQRVGGITGVEAVARHFNVSLRAATIRLIDLDAADQSLYGAIDKAADYKRRKGGGGSGETTPERRLREYGSAFPKTLIRATDSGLLSRNDLLEYLNVSSTQLHELRQLTGS